MPRLLPHPFASALLALGLFLSPSPGWSQAFEGLLAADSPQCVAYLAPPPAASVSASPATREAARCRFMAFAGDWMLRIGRNLRHTEGDMEISRDGAGYVARFVRLDTASAQVAVKPSTSVSSPYVGILRYEEHHFEGRGHSVESAANGPFRRVRRLRVTEIFRFVSGRWTN